MESFLNLLIHLAISGYTQKAEVQIPLYCINIWSPGVRPVQGSVLNLREGCREVMVCTGVSDSAPLWRTLGSHGGLLNSTNVLIDASAMIWRSTYVFESLLPTDTGRYMCDPSGGLYRDPIMLKVAEGAIGMKTTDINLSCYTNGDLLTIQCIINTCLSDMVIQLFHEDQLLEPTTQDVTMNGFVLTAWLRASDLLVGQYLCQAVNQVHNKFTQQTFSIYGSPQPSRSC